MNQARDKAHGYNFEKLMDEGIPVVEAHQAFRELYDQCKLVSGFNVWFDHKIIRGEAKRLGYPIPFREKQAVCVMRASRSPCGLGKNPKLSEAVRILLGRRHDSAHSAGGDVAATVDLYRHLKPLGVLRIEDQPGVPSNGR